MCRPLISTYAVLFQERIGLFKKKAHFREKELVCHQLPGNLHIRISAGVPSSQSSKNSSMLSNSNPHPIQWTSEIVSVGLSLNAVQEMEGARPPVLLLVTALWEEHRASSSPTSVSSLPDVSDSEPLLHRKREFRDGGITHYPSKLRLFIMSCKDTLF